jgi:DNA helicase-2/ATP-dependent DNA helicase PcrA
LIQNFNDEISLERIINEPKRNIGEASFKKILALARERGITPIEWGLRSMDFQLQTISELKIQSSKIEALANFCKFIVKAKEKSTQVSVAKLIEFVFVESGYEKALLDGTDEGQVRYENVKELQTVARKYDEYGEDGLSLFLEEVALIADTDNIDQSTESVHLMTLHSAKGLEFNTVFIIGLEEGIFPHSRSVMSSNEMEEERRLMYVGITRAKEKIYLLYTKERNIFGSFQVNSPSRFIDDIPEHLVAVALGDMKKTFSGKKLMIRNKPIIKKNTYADGDRVNHPVFGTGLIVSSQGDIVTIAFSQSGLKKLSVAVAPLEKIK